MKNEEVKTVIKAILALILIGVGSQLNKESMKGYKKSLEKT